MPTAEALCLAPRERATIDLRGLGPSAQGARARSQPHRIGRGTADIVELLKISGSETTVQASSASEVARDGRGKLTLGLRRGVAARLTTRARACGLSQSAYLTTLIEEAPAPPLALATALGTSTEQLAVVSADLNELIRTFARDTTSSGPLVKEWPAELLHVLTPEWHPMSLSLPPPAPTHHQCSVRQVQADEFTTVAWRALHVALADVGGAGDLRGIPLRSLGDVLGSRQLGVRPAGH